MEHLEAFCCSQVERIERMLNARYSMEIDQPPSQKWERTVPDNRYMVMPQNDHVTRLTLMRDGLVEWRGSCGAMGRSQGGAQ
jgi:hypothetical protein